MNKQMLEQAMQKLKEDVGGALEYFSLVSLDTGQSILGYNNTEKMDAYNVLAFNALEKTIVVNEYLLVDHTDGTIGMVVKLPRYLAIVRINKEKMMVGMFLSVILPEMRENLLAAFNAN